MSFLDAIIERQKQEHSGAPAVEPFEVILRRTHVVEGEMVTLRIRAIIDPSISYMETEVVDSEEVRLVGKRIEINSNAPFLQHVDQYYLNRFKVGGLIRLSCVKQGASHNIFVYDYKD